MRTRGHVEIRIQGKEDMYHTRLGEDIENTKIEIRTLRKRDIDYSRGKLK